MYRADYSPYNEDDSILGSLLGADPYENYMAVSVGWGILEKGLGAPLKRFGVDIGQGWSSFGHKNHQAVSATFLVLFCASIWVDNRAAEFFATFHIPSTRYHLPYIPYHVLYTVYATAYTLYHVLHTMFGLLISWKLAFVARWKML